MRMYSMAAAGLMLLAAVGQQPRDVSGTWVAKVETPMGEIEIVYDLKVVDGKVTGTQRLPFGDSPIVDGKIDGDRIELQVDTEFFGNIQRRVASGTIVGDEIRITPALPAFPPGGGPGGPAGPGGPPAGGGAPGANAAGQPPRPAGAGGAGPGAGGAGRPGGGPGGGGGGMRALLANPIVMRRGTPTPSYRAPSLDYKTLAKVELPPLKTLPANGLALTPPMGWNSWNKFRTRIDDRTVREIADAIVASGMKDAGYQYINIDDGWQWKRDARGVLLPNPNFPDMKALAAYVHGKGLKLGIYSSPGPRTCGGFEGSYGHEEIDARTWADWGIDYLKYDWCSASRIWQDMDMQAVYQRMGEALAKTGRPIVYSLCQYGRQQVQEWGPRVGGNLWRTTFDIRDTWQSMTQIGFSQDPLSTYARPGQWNDPDMLEVGNSGMSRAEYETHFSLWAILAAPLLAGNDLRAMTADTKEILLNKEVIAVNQDKKGAAGRRVSATGTTEIWTRPLADGATAVALFNRGEDEATIAVKWTDISARGPLQVRDLWTHTDRGHHADGFTATVRPHGVALLRVSNTR